MERKIIWVGFGQQAVFYSQALGLTRPRVIQSSHGLEGFKSPLTIVLCGEWWKLKEISQIQQAIKRLEVFEDVKVVKLES